MDSARSAMRQQPLLSLGGLFYYLTCSPGAGYEDSAENLWRDTDLPGPVAGGAEHNRARAPAKNARSVAEREPGCHAGGLVVHRPSFHSRGSDADEVSASSLGNDLLCEL